jgi:hypothetical protein
MRLDCSLLAFQERAKVGVEAMALALNSLTESQEEALEAIDTSVGDLEEPTLVDIMKATMVPAAGASGSGAAATAVAAAPEAGQGEEVAAMKEERAQSGARASGSRAAGTAAGGRGKGGARGGKRGRQQQQKPLLLQGAQEEGGEAAASVRASWEAMYRLRPRVFELYGAIPGGLRLAPGEPAEAPALALAAPARASSLGGSVFMMPAAVDGAVAGPSNQQQPPPQHGRQALVPGEGPSSIAGIRQMLVDEWSSRLSKARDYVSSLQDTAAADLSGAGALAKAADQASRELAQQQQQQPQPQQQQQLALPWHGAEEEQGGDPGAVSPDEVLVDVAVYGPGRSDVISDEMLLLGSQKVREWPGAPPGRAMRAATSVC